jgi:Uma2 family endonuclease
VVRAEQRGIIRNRRIEGVSAMLVEVLSPSNPDTDTDTKRKAYAQAGVPEYWIVRPAQRDMLIYTQPDGELADYAQSTHVEPDGELVSPTLPIRTAVAGFFAGAPDTTL